MQRFNKLISNLIILISIILLVTIYIPSLFADEGLFFKSNLVFLYYLMSESVYNGLIVLMLFSFFTGVLNVRSVITSFSLGIIINYLRIIPELHYLLLDHNLFPKFLAVDANDQPSEQYTRLYLMLTVLGFTSIGNFFVNKSPKLIFFSIFTIAYFLFFTLGHFYVLKMYNIEKKNELQRVELILNNFDSLKDICTKYNSQCGIIKDDKISITIPYRNSIFKNYQTRDDIDKMLNSEYQSFRNSDDTFMANLDTSLVKESVKYAFLKKDGATYYFIDTMHLTRASDFYVGLFNTLQILFISIWVFMGVVLFRFHKDKFKN